MKKRVLVVDDDPDLLEVVSDVLAEEGYEVLRAANGRAALELLQRGARPAVILLDLMMPVMDGRQFRQEQRRDRAIADIPIVVFSASRDPERAAVELAAAACMRKPVSVEALLAMVRRFAEPGSHERRQATPIASRK